MSTSLLCLVGFASWTLLLAATTLGYRTWFVVVDGRPANSFTPTGEELSPFSARLCRAHANCVENLPVVAAIVLVAAVTDRLDVTDGLAAPFLAARIAQSSVHLVSTSATAVLVRAACYVVQIAVQAWWVGQLVLG